MASAEKTVETVMIESHREAIELTLSIPEAETLATIMVFVGGHPGTSRRNHANAILTALNRAGVTSLPWEYRDHHVTGILNFALEQDFDKPYDETN